MAVHVLKKGLDLPITGAPEQRVHEAPATAMVAVHTRQLNTALRIEQARVRSELHNKGPKMVLAIACDRLETGEPSSF